MGLSKRLTEKQKKFAELLVYNDGSRDAWECAKEAGYGPNSDLAARVASSKLTNPQLYPLVVRYIGELREEARKKYAVTMDRHLEQLSKIRDQALKKGAFSAAGNMEVARGKVAGYYIDRKMIKTGKIDELDRDQLMAKLEKIVTDHSKIIDGESADIKPQLQLEQLSEPEDETETKEETEQDLLEEPILDNQESQ
jgi:hypothetical protein|tara:strand:+ start:946 stop:1533 length:588 start_codon:yes stop_codon:yes gene_type:complete